MILTLLVGAFLLAFMLVGLLGLVAEAPVLLLIVPAFLLYLVQRRWVENEERKRSERIRQQRMFEQSRTVRSLSIHNKAIDLDRAPSQTSLVIPILNLSYHRKAVK